MKECRYILLLYHILYNLTYNNIQSKNKEKVIKSPVNHSKKELGILYYFILLSKKKKKRNIEKSLIYEEYLVNVTNSGFLLAYVVVV